MTSNGLFMEKGEALVKKLRIRTRILSLRGRIEISDEEGGSLYEARGEFSLFRPTWRVRYATREIASIRRRLWSLHPTWDVRSDAGEFRVQRKLWSWRRHYHVLDGPFVGAELTGDFWGLTFELQHGGAVIARADGQAFQVAEQHEIELLDADPKSEHLTVIAMVILHMDRRRQSRNSGGS